MVRIRCVEERKLWVLTLILADLLLELRRVGGTCDESRGTVNDSCKSKEIESALARRAKYICRRKSDSHLISGGGRISPLANLGSFDTPF